MYFNRFTWSAFAAVLMILGSVKTGAVASGFSIEEGTPGDTISFDAAGRVVRVKVGNGDCGERNGFNDCAHDRERAELTGISRQVFLRDQSRDGEIYRAKIFFPANFSAPKNGMGVTVYQLKVPGNPPAMDLFFRGSGDLRVKMDHSYKIGNWDYAQSYSRDPVIIKDEDLRGKWHQISIQAHWANDITGQVRLFVDGKEAFSYSGPNLLAGKGVYVKHGIYRWDVSKDPTRKPTVVLFKDVTASNAP